MKPTTFAILVAVALVAVYFLGGFQFTTLGSTDYTTPHYILVSPGYYIGHSVSHIGMLKTSYGQSEVPVISSAWLKMTYGSHTEADATNWVMYVDGVDYVWKINDQAYNAPSFRTTNGEMSIYNAEMAIERTGETPPVGLAIGDIVTIRMVLNIRFTSTQGTLALAPYWMGEYSYSIIADTAVNEPPVVTASATPLSGDVPLAVTFTSTATDSDGSIASYHWDYGHDSATSNYASGSHTYTEIGQYTATLKVTDNDGAVTTRTFTIYVNTLSSNAPPVIQSTSVNPQTGIVPLRVYVSATATDSNGQITSVKWDFGDGASATTLQAEHEYTIAGTYSVCLSVTDNDGAVATKTFSIAVSPAPIDDPPPTDTDGDGYPDSTDAFPTDPNEWADADGDGIGDNADTDDGDDDGADTASDTPFLVMIVCVGLIGAGIILAQLGYIRWLLIISGVVGLVWSAMTMGVL